MGIDFLALKLVLFSFIDATLFKFSYRFTNTGRIRLIEYNTKPGRDHGNIIGGGAINNTNAALQCL
ncbi:MAG: hypothetical protein CVV01_04385 [Firmicutes bacterium HGW-Firmicutes-6]|nr:MAG: hypothetical protein CVV01_04385 [Firmicutes bacterium HGW-Firmicutes-6]